MQIDKKINLLNPIQGLTRSILALATILVLLLNNLEVIFKPEGSLNEFLYPFLGHDINLFYLFGFKWGKIISVIILFFVLIGYRPRYFYFLHLYVSFCFLNGCKYIEGGDQINYLLTLFICPLAFIDSRKWHWFYLNEDTLKAMKKKIVNELSLIIFILINAQAFVFYFHASVGKFFIPDWLNGVAIYYFFNDAVYGAPLYLRPLLNIILNNDYLIVFTTYFVLFLELMLSICIFMPIKFKPLFFLLGITFHFLIAFVHGIPDFFLNISAFLLLFTIDYRLISSSIEVAYNTWLCRYSGNYNLYYDSNNKLCNLFISKFGKNFSDKIKVNFIPIKDCNFGKLRLISINRYSAIDLYEVAAVNFIISMSSKRYFILLILLRKLYLPFIIQKYFYKWFAKNRNHFSRVLK